MKDIELQESQKNGTVQATKSSTDEPVAPVSEATYWQNRYENNETKWDLADENPTFTLIREQQIIQNHCNKNVSDISLWIPGCGNGYDAVGYAREGYNVTAVDFANTPIARLSDIVKEESLPLKPLQLDIFNLPKEFHGSFDCALEYTCYCAIAPERRQEYAHILADSLCEGGILIGIFFPLGGTNTTRPPFGVTEKDVANDFIHAGFSLVKQYLPSQASHPEREGQEVVMHFIKL